MKKVVFTAFLITLLFSCQQDPETTRDEFYLSGQVYMQEGKFEEASIEFLNALKADGGYIPARMLLADAYTAQGKLPNAIAELRKIIDQEPENIEAKLKLARFYLLAAGFQGQQWYEEVRRLANEVLKTDPANVDAHILLGNSYAGLRDYGRSVRKLQNALETDPDNLRAFLDIGTLELQRNHLEEAEAAFRDAVERNPDSPLAYNALGSFFMATGNTEEAEAVFRKAYEIAPNDRLAVYGLVKYYLFVQSPARAKEILKEALSASPDSVDFITDLANIEMLDDNREAAVRLLEEAYENHPEEPRLAVRLAEIEFNAGSVQKARDLIDRVVEDHPDYAEGRLFRAELLLRDEDFDQALSETEEALRLNPTYVDALDLKSDLLLRKGLLAEAESTARQALNLGQGNLQARAKLAKLLAFNYRSADALNEALVHATRVLEVMPENFDALSARAEAELRTNNLPSARRDFEKLLQGRGSNPYLLHRLGKVAALEGKNQEALEYYRSALKSAPDLEEGIRDLVAVYLKNERHQEAIRELDRLAADSGKKDLYHLYKGQVYIQMKNFGAAEEELRRAIQLNPDNTQAYYGLGHVFVQRGDITQAIREIDELIARNEQSPQGYLLKAYYLQNAGDSEQAVENYRIVLDLANEGDPIWCVAANNIAWRLALLEKNLNEARMLAEKAREYQPYDARFADTLGWVYYKLGNYALAVNQLLYSVNQGNPGAGHYYRLGMAYFKNGDKIKAQQTLRAALSLSTNFEGAEEARTALSALRGS